MSAEIRDKGIAILQAVYEKQAARLAGLVGRDPVAFVHDYRQGTDIEIAGFLASQFAYGRVGTIRDFLGRLFDAMGGSPARFLGGRDFKAVRPLYYRFQKGEEIVRLLAVLSEMVERYGGIGGLLRRCYDGDVRKMIWRIREELGLQGDDLSFFFPRPSSSSPMKRWSLYLRWMVRKDMIDFGLWDFIPRDELVIPLDTHVYKIGRCRGWTTRKSQSWKAATEITESLRHICPDDPLKFDFFLCHVVGIEGGCAGVRSDACRGRCILGG